MSRQKMLSRMVRVKAENLDAWITGLSDEERERLWAEWGELARAAKEAIEAFFRDLSPIIFDMLAQVRKAVEEIGPPNVLKGPKPKEERNTQENPSTPGE